MNRLTSILVVILLMLIAITGRAWDVDFSRRQKPKSSFTAPSNEAEPITVEGLAVKSVHEDTVRDRQELVILNTQKGFVPAQVRLHKGLHYKIHVVNVNEDKKNVSFIMDEFNQHYATYYGQIKTFNMDPDKEGVYKFECPETTNSGTLVVFGNGKTNAPAPVAPPFQVQPSIDRFPSSER